MSRIPATSKQTKLFAFEKGNVLIWVKTEILRRLINGYDAVVPYARLTLFAGENVMSMPSPSRPVVVSNAWPGRCLYAGYELISAEPLPKLQQYY